MWFTLGKLALQTGAEDYTLIEKSKDFRKRSRS
jgi:hypothetical protein